MTATDSMRIVFLGSGAFGLPCLETLFERCEVPLVVSQPDRPAGRGRQNTPTPISAAVLEREGTELLRVESVNDSEVRARIMEMKPDALVIIAFGQKIGRELLDACFAINLHGSLLPRWRGAAPINRAMMAGDEEAGVSIIALADRMDAGDVYATRAITVEPDETAGELHDRLAVIGGDAVMAVLEAHAQGKAEAVPQDEAKSCHAAKLSRADGVVDCHDPSRLVRSRINGLSPWPGCDAAFRGKRLRLKRAGLAEGPDPGDAEPGTLTPEGLLRCGDGWIRLLEVQPPGKPAMPWDAFSRGRGIEAGDRLEPISSLDQ